VNTNFAMQRRSIMPWVTIALAAYWLLVVAAMHLLEPEFDPIKDYVSPYVLGAYGVWMTTSFFAGAGIMFLLAFGLARSLPRTLWTNAGVVLFCIAGCGELVMGLSPAQYPLTPPLTQQTLIQLLAGLATFNAFALGCVSLSISFRGTAHWRLVSMPALILSVLLLAMCNDRWLWRIGQGTDGLEERVVIALMFLWLGLVLRAWFRWSSEAGAGVGFRAPAGTRE
jgi:hypothetical protein